MDPTEPRIFVQNIEDATIVTLHDDRIVEPDHIAQLEESIMAVVDKASRLNLILDFCHVRSLSSALLGLLVKIHKRLSERKGHLELCNVDPGIYEVFKITRLDKVLDVKQKQR